MKKIFVVLAAMMLLFSCNKNSDQKNQSISNMKLEDMTLEKIEYSTDTTTAPFDQNEPEEANDKKKQPVKQSTPNPDWDKKIIKNATLNVEVSDDQKFYSTFLEKVRNLGGYVAQEEQNQSEYRIENTIVLKVPFDQFENAVAILTTGVEKINEKKISSQDVTAEYVDTRSRIEAKKQFRNRYMDLLKQAKNMEEILSVQSEINNIQEEIESATGRMNYLGQSSAFSTISLTYYKVLDSSSKENTSPSFVSKITEAFKTGLGWISDLFIGLISIWPLLLASFVLIIIYKKIKPVKAKQA